MRRHRRYSATKRRNKLFQVKLIAIMMLLCILLSSMDCKIRPIIKSLAQTQAVILATRVIDQSVTDFIEDKNISYDYLVSVFKNEAGNVTSIQANSLHINSLKAKISTTITDKIAEIEHKAISIPVGTLIGGDFFSGRGPRITFYISLSGSVTSKLGSSFYEAGINQTIHAISLEIAASIYIICPGYNTSTVTKTNMAIAETVIVGEVPETYNYINANLDDYTANYPLQGD